MHLAINTGSLSFDTREAIAQLHGLGFSAVELNLQQAEFGYGFARTPDLAFYDDLAREVRVRKLIVTDAHALFLNAAQMFSARARCEILSIEGQVTRLLGARTLVVHPTDILNDEDGLESFITGRQTHAPLIEWIEFAVRELQSDGVQVALENVQHWRGTRGTNDAEVMARLVDALDCHVTLDVRRSMNRPSLERWLELLGDRIAVLHLHDSVDEVEHHPPSAPEWKQIMPQLKRTSAHVCVIESSANRSPGAIKVSREYIGNLLQAE